MSERADDLHELFEGLASDIQDAAPLARSRLRKTRVRRASVAGALALSLATIGAGAALVGFGPGRGAGAGIGPATGSQATIPPPPRPMHGEIEAWGEAKGVRYWLTVYEDGGNRICMELERGSALIHPYCDEFRSDRAGVKSQTVDLEGNRFVYGWIPENHGRVTLLRRRGPDRYVATWPAPGNVATPVRFFLLAHVPEDTEGVETTVEGNSVITWVYPQLRFRSLKSGKGPNIDVFMPDCTKVGVHRPKALSRCLADSARRMETEVTARGTKE